MLTPSGRVKTFGAIAVIMLSVVADLRTKICHFCTAYGGVVCRAMLWQKSQSSHCNDSLIVVDATAEPQGRRHVG
jgi:hypothetical protein